MIKEEHILHLTLYSILTDTIDIFLYSIASHSFAVGYLLLLHVEEDEKPGFRTENQRDRAENSLQNPSCPVFTVKYSEPDTVSGSVWERLLR